MEHLEPWLEAYQLRDLRGTIERMTAPVPPVWYDYYSVLRSSLLIRCFYCHRVFCLTNFTVHNSAHMCVWCKYDMYGLPTVE
jgi:hypothetical protein